MLQRIVLVLICAVCVSCSTTDETGSRQDNDPAYNVKHSNKFNKDSKLQADNTPDVIIKDKCTLQELVRLALSKNGLIESLKLRITEEQYRTKQSMKGENPSLGISMGKKSVSGDSGSLSDISLFQPFLWPGKLSTRGEIGDIETEIRKLERSEIELLVTYDVTNLAIEYELTRRKKLLIDSRLRRFHLIRSYLEGRPFVSPQKKVEKLLVENRIRELEALNIEASNDIKLSLARLSLYVTIEPDVTPEIELKFPESDKMIEDSDFVQDMIANNLSIALKKLEITKTAKEKQLAELGAYPDFQIGPFLDRESANETEKFYGIGFSMTLPVINRNQDGVLSLSYRILAEEKALEYRIKELLSLLKQAVTEFDSTRRVAKTFDAEAIKQAESGLNEAEKDFEKGLLDLLLYKELEEKTWELNVRHLESKFGAAKKLLAILLLTSDTNPVAKLSEF